MIENHDTRLGPLLSRNHFLVDIEELCPRVVVLDAGKVAFDGLLADLVAAHPDKDIESVVAGLYENGR